MVLPRDRIAWIERHERAKLLLCSFKIPQLRPDHAKLSPRHAVKRIDLQGFHEAQAAFLKPSLLKRHEPKPVVPLHIFRTKLESTGKLATCLLELPNLGES